ncbi:unnamed protein product [Orchesella dallaii]|uniref:peptidylprolyl isomerase n=1 Tax=Orchesella dallaii TaxID=48710 RepID=A0ABP1PRG1_9HEXA
MEQEAKDSVPDVGGGDASSDATSSQNRGGDGGDRGYGNYYRGRGGSRGRGRGGQGHHHKREPIDLKEIPIPPELIPSTQGRNHVSKPGGGDSPILGGYNVPPCPYGGCAPASTAVDITPEKNGKLWKVILQPAEPHLIAAPPLDGMVAQIHYKSWLLADDTKEIFDASSFYEGDTSPLEFVLGKRETIRAINDGVQTMFKGEKALFIAHFDYAYSRYSASKPHTGNIPNKSHICTEVELAAVFDVFDGLQDDEDAREVVREMVQVCEDGEEMHENTIAFVKLTGYYDDKVFFPVKLLPYVPYDNNWGNSEAAMLLPYSLGKTVCSMKCGEKAWVTLKGCSAFESDFEDKSQGLIIKAGDVIKFLVEIEEVEQILDPFVLSFAEKIDGSKELLEQGETFMERDCADAAFYKFSRVEEYLVGAKDYLKHIPEELSLSADRLLFQALFNMACMFGKTQNVELNTALLRCNQALELATSFPQSSVLTGKVYYQRGMLRMGQKEFELAKEDFQKAIQTVFDSGELKQSKLVLDAKEMLVMAEEKRKDQKKTYPLRYFPPK